MKNVIVWIKFWKWIHLQSQFHFSFSFPSESEMRFFHEIHPWAENWHILLGEEQREHSTRRYLHGRESFRWAVRARGQMQRRVARHSQGRGEASAGTARWYELNTWRHTHTFAHTITCSRANAAACCASLKGGKKRLLAQLDIINMHTQAHTNMRALSRISCTCSILYTHTSDNFLVYLTRIDLFAIASDSSK